MPPVIEVDRLVKRYRHSEVNAVDGVSFSVNQGQFFTLLGPNGAGKTTTVSVLTTTLAPTGGTARVAGYDVAREAGRVRRRIGIIFQRPSLDLNLTGEGNVRFHAVLYGLYPYRPTFSTMPRAYQEQVRGLASVLGIEDDIFKPVKRLSGGMRRKLEIVRSLMHHPQVLFLDEPTAGLDTETRRNLWQYIRSMRDEKGTTVFLTTHHLEEAEQADRVCIIDRGRVAAFGSPEEIKAALAQEYLVLDAADRAALRAELAALGIPFAETPLVRVPLDGHRAQEVVKAIRTPLTVLRSHAPTLEDAYLAIVARQQAGEEAES